MINSQISFLYRELSEILNTIESRIIYVEGEEIDLLKNLELIKNKVQTERWIERCYEDELERNMNSDEWIPRSILPQMALVNWILEDMVENKDCYVATKVSRTFLKLVGKVFQGIANLMIV